MRIVLLNGMLPSANGELLKANHIVKQTLEELSVEIEEINIPLLNIPYFDGDKIDNVEEIMKKVEAADGVIFSNAVTICSFGGAMQCFLEYNNSSEVLAEKQCMSLLVGEPYAVTEGIHFYSRIIRYLGGYDTSRIEVYNGCLGSEHETEFIEIIEKQTEDYYRFVSQNRKLRIGKREWGHQSVYTGVPQSNASKINSTAEVKKKDVTALYEKYKLDSLNENQEKDIQELTQLFKQKFQKNLDDEKQIIEKKRDSFFTEELVEQSFVVPQTKTCHQMVRSMPHYFQPQVANHMKEKIQLVISGDEKITGYLDIGQGECTFVEGEADGPSITILSDTNVWKDIMKGKITAQKAFMIGQLKVRGNFVLLTQLDQIFQFKQ